MEHISNPELRAFAERHLTPDRLLKVDDHLAACPACREALVHESQVGPSVTGLQADFALAKPHLEYEQLLSVAEGQRLAPELEHHVSHCGSCAYEVEELRNFVAETSKVARSFRVVQPVAERTRILSWRPRLVWYALAAAVLIGAGMYWQASLRSSHSGLTTASLRDGDYQLSLDKRGQLHGAEALQPDQLEAMQAALASGRLAVTKPSNFANNQQETLLGVPVAAPPFKIMSPVNRVVIDDRPTFVWESMPNTTGYRVRIYTSGYRKIAESPLTQSTSWQASSPLPRGQSYTWTVTAKGPKGEVRAPAPPQPEAAFEVIDTHTAATLDQASSSHGADHLLLAILYSRAGAIDEARAQLDLLAVQNPGNKLVDQLKASLDQSAPSPIRTNAAQ